MTKEIIIETDVKADYTKYVYFCSPDKKTGNLNVVRAERSLGKKVK